MKNCSLWTKKEGRVGRLKKKARKLLPYKTDVNENVDDTI
jgi:hypothetical protein